MNPPRQPLRSSESRAQGRTLPRVPGSTAATCGTPSALNNHGNNPNNDQGRVWEAGEKEKVQVGRNNT